MIPFRDLLYNEHRLNIEDIVCIGPDYTIVRETASTRKRKPRRHRGTESQKAGRPKDGEE